MAARRRCVPACCFPTCPPANRARAHTAAGWSERGRYQFGPVRLSTRFPFGLFSRTITVGESETLIVLPRLGRLTEGWAARRLEAFAGADRRRRRSGPEGDFYGVREWRSGDGRRLIHWRSSARLGKLVVRQFERPRSRDVAVVLDLWQPEPATAEHLENVELAVSFAATVLADLCRQGGSNVYLALEQPRAGMLGRAGLARVVAGPDGAIGHRRGAGRRLASRLVGRRLAARRRRRRDRGGQHAAGRPGRHHAVRRPLVRSGPARPCAADPMRRYVERYLVQYFQAE